MFDQMLLPARTAVKNPATDTLVAARTKATTAGTDGLTPHTEATKKGAKIGMAPITKNVAVIFRESLGRGMSTLVLIAPDQARKDYVVATHDVHYELYGLVADPSLR